MFYFSLSLSRSLFPSAHLSTYSCIIPIQSSIAPSFTNTIVPLRGVPFAGAQKVRRAIEFEWQGRRKSTNRRRKVALMRRLGWRCLDWWGKGQKTSKILPIVADGSCEFLCQPISGYFWDNGIIVTRWPFNISWFGSNMGTKNWPTKSSMHKIHIIIWSQDVLSFFLFLSSFFLSFFLFFFCPLSFLSRNYLCYPDMIQFVFFDPDNNL